MQPAALNCCERVLSVYPFCRRRLCPWQRMDIYISSRWRGDRPRWYVYVRCHLISVLMIRQSAQAKRLLFPRFIRPGSCAFWVGVCVVCTMTPAPAAGRPVGLCLRSRIWASQPGPVPPVSDSSTGASCRWLCFSTGRVMGPGSERPLQAPWRVRK